MNKNKLNNVELEKYLRSLVNKNRLIESEILLILSEVKRRKLVQQQGFVNLAAYCESRLGLSRDQAWKRSQATSVIEIAPEALDLLKNGKTYITSLAMVAPKITKTNKKQILNILPRASKSELNLFLQTIDGNGNKLDIEPTVTIKLKCSAEMLKKLERLQGLLVQSQLKSDKESVIERAIDSLLEKLDPIKKQERREKRNIKKLENKSAKPKEDHKPRLVTRALPEAIKAEVLKRDGYCCTYINVHGERCKENSILEIDHIKPWALGGNHSMLNLRTLCRSHNLMCASRVFGEKFMNARKRVSDPVALNKSGVAIKTQTANGSQPSEQLSKLMQSA